MNKSQFDVVLYADDENFVEQLTAALDADKPVCGNCGGICNPLSEGSGYCDVCKGTGKEASNG